MPPAKLTPQEYELDLTGLCQRLRDYLEAGTGDVKALRRDAEAVLELADEFPQVIECHPEVNGLAAGLLARMEQQKFLAPAEGAASAGDEAPGCLLGWLLGGKRG